MRFLRSTKQVLCLYSIMTLITYFRVGRSAQKACLTKSARINVAYKAVITPEITLDVTSPGCLEGYMLHRWCYVGFGLVFVLFFFPELIACNISASTLITTPCSYRAQSGQLRADNSNWHVAYLRLIEIYPFQSDFVDRNSTFAVLTSPEVLSYNTYTVSYCSSERLLVPVIKIHICAVLVRKKIWGGWQYN